MAAELIFKYLKLGGEQTFNTAFHESRLQVNLLFIQNEFEKAISDIKIRNNHVLFIDGIDIRPGSISYRDYLECVKGLASAVWSLNNDFFPKIRDSKGRFRAVLLLRPDIFNSIGLQNLTNKIRDNGVYLDWRTTYPSHRTSDIFELTDKLLSAQQGGIFSLGEAWDYYFPWKSYPTSPERENDPSFIGLLRMSYSRPRDMVAIIQILQEEFVQKRKSNTSVFSEKDLDSRDFQNKYSEYLMGGLRTNWHFIIIMKIMKCSLGFLLFLVAKMSLIIKSIWRLIINLLNLY